MFSNISLKTKIILSVWAVLLITILLPWIYFVNIIKTEINKESISNIKKEFVLVKYILHNSNINKNNIDDVIKDIGEKLGDRITYILKDGKVIADSKVKKDRLSKLDNHATRPEIIMARRTGHGSSVRYSGTIHRKLIYYAEPVKFNNLDPGYLRIARYYSLVDSVLNNINIQIVYVLFFSFLISGAIISYFIILIMKRIKPIIDLSEALSNGQEVKLITKSPAKEFDKLVTSLNKMAIQITNNLNLISNQKKELQAILDAIDAPVVVVDQYGKIIKSNKTFKTYFTSDTSEKDLPSLIINSKLIEGLENALKNGEYIRGIPVTLKRRHYSVNIIPISYKKEITAILVFHDITEQKKLDKTRRDFFANVSHELKTPLTSIQGYAETILDDLYLDKEQIKIFLNKILKNCEEMRELINGIMEISKIETGEIKTKIELIDLKLILNDVWISLKQIAEKKNIKFKNIDKPFKIKYDREKLYTILKNLIHNSIKFSHTNGEISVKIKEQKDFYQIGIEDRGVGIPFEEQDRVFERFYQTKDAIKSKAPGYGLGLSICRNIVHYFGGQIWIESPIEKGDKGCIVWFTIPKEIEEKNRGRAKNETL